MSHTVIGFFKQRVNADDAVKQLTESGIDRDKIDVSNGNETQSDITLDSDSTVDSGVTSVENNTSRESYESKSTAVSRFFSSLFGNESDDSRKYANASESAETIVTVHATAMAEAEEVANILDGCGAMDIDESSLVADTYDQVGSFEHGSDTQDSPEDARQIEGESAADRKDDKIEVMRERLSVGKRSVSTGGVKVRSRIVEKPVEENLRLREEHIRVNRKVVDRVADLNDLGTFKDQEIELTEYAEVPVINKEARVVEEIRISKDVNQREETIHETLRETQVDIENDRTKS